MSSVATQAQAALEAGYQVCVHAIGDRANREVLDVFEETFERNNRNGRDLRWRIEHAQHLHRDDIPRFGQLNVIASMQGVHATSDAPWVEPRLGAERAEEGAGNVEEARKLYSEVATFNFNSIGFALVGQDAKARAGAT